MTEEVTQVELGNIFATDDGPTTYNGKIAILANEIAKTQTQFFHVCKIVQEMNERVGKLFEEYEKHAKTAKV